MGQSWKTTASQILTYLARIPAQVGGKLPVDATIGASALPTGAATEQGLDDILAKLSADPATQTTLAAILAKIIAAPATEAKQIDGNASLVSILAHLVTKKVQLHANIDISQATAYTAIAAPSAGYRIRLTQLCLMSGAATPVNSEIGIKSASTLLKTVKGAAIVLDFPEHCNLGTAEALVLLATTADRIVGGVDYYVEAI